MIRSQKLAGLVSLASLSLAALAGCGSASDQEDAPSASLPQVETSSIEPSRYRAWHAAQTTTTTTSQATTTTPTTAPTAPTAPTTAPTAPTTDGTPAPVAPATKLPYRGVNLAGAEFGSNLPGVYGTDYTFPTPAEVDYYLAKGMNTFRVEFRWERLQPAAYGAFDATYASRLDALVTYATSKGAHVVLNPQNFARYYGNTVGSAQVPNEVFADFWSKLSTIYASNPNVMFNLVNEPNSMATEQWVGAANAAIHAIRAVAPTNTIVVPGNNWTGAGSWADSGYGTPNSVAMLAIDDSSGNILFEAHLYMDADASGSTPNCTSTTIGADRLAVFVKWLRDNHKKGFLGEFAGADNDTCRTGVTNLLTALDASSDVMEGWLWWAGGPWWNDYMFTLDPTTAGADRPQWALISPWLAR